MEGEIVECLAGKPEIVINDSEGVLRSSTALQHVVNELVKNAVEEREGEITVIVKKGEIVVTGDRRHDDPEAILENLNRSKPQSRKDDKQRMTGFNRGGAGIILCRDILEKTFEGNLSFEATEDGRIKAIATWPTR